MGRTNFGNFGDFCRDSTLPVCNLFVANNQPPNAKFHGCALTGIHIGGTKYLANLGSIILCGIAIAVTLLLLWLSERKKAAVGRREIQVFLLGYIIIEICEIFSVGGFPLDDSVRKGFSVVHIAVITATTWVLMLNAIVSFQLIDDGTPLSVGMVFVSGLILFLGTGYIALDTGFNYTGEFMTTAPSYRNYALYVLYQLFPLICLFAFFVLETFVAVKVLGELKPMLYLTTSLLLFAIGQVFEYVISVHICRSTSGRVNGALFETFFTLLSVVMVWVFWSSITEDDWPTATVPPVQYESWAPMGHPRVLD